MKHHSHLPHFEETLIKRIAVGYSIARNTLPTLEMDEAMMHLIEDEIKNRNIIRGNPEHEILKQILIETEGDGIDTLELKSFLKNWYQFPEDHVKSLIMGYTRRGKCIKSGRRYYHTEKKKEQIML
jgi:ribosomal protein L4